MAAEAIAPAPPDTAPPVAAPAAAPASETKSKGSKKDKASKKDASAGAPDSAREALPTIAGHPRAARSVARAKGWGGLGGFLLAGYLSLATHAPAEAAARALVAGAVCYVAAWAGAVFIWKRLVMIELRGRQMAAMESARMQIEAARTQMAGETQAVPPERKPV